MNKGDTHYRHPSLADGRDLWALVQAAGTLDLNSSYLYLLLCDHFAETCVLAERENELVGFVTAYQPPSRPDTLFVWQIGVLPSARGLGIAKGLVMALLNREVCRPVRWIEATISPSNSASRALFQALAQGLSVEIQEQPYFTEDHFPPGAGHESEPLLRLGPLASAQPHS